MHKEQAVVNLTDHKRKLLLCEIDDYDGVEY